MLQHLPGYNLWTARNDACGGGGVPMAKMRYKEMPRETSADSLRTIEEVYERGRLRVLGGSASEGGGVGGLFLGIGGGVGGVGGGSSGGGWSEEDEDRLLSPGSEDGPPGEEDKGEDTDDGGLVMKAPTPRSRPSSAKKKNKGCGDRLAPPPSPITPGGGVACGYDNPASWKSQSLPAGGGSCPRDLLESVVLESLRVSPEDLASQLTLLDLAAFVKIAPSELASTSWNKRNKLTVAPNVVAFTQRFNHVSFWTVQEVLSGTTPKHRAEIISHFVRTCRKLYDLNNFHSLFAIVSALQSASVYRLSKSWSHVGKKEKASFERLAEVFSDQSNWRRLREHVESLNLPCIPYLGLFLTDLVYIEMAHPSKEARAGKVERVLQLVKALQASTYPSLPTLPVVQRYLASVRYIDELQKFLEDDHYKLSLRLEPPSPVVSSCSSKESVAEGSLSPAKLPPQTAANHKFTPGHRKSSSLGSNIITTHSTTGRHLLDDSVLEEGSHLSNSKALQHLNLSPLKRLPCLSLCGVGDENQVRLQGALRRKTLLKEGRKPTVASWQRYWVQLWANSLVFYLPKAFKGSERCDFKREPCKVSPMTGCLVSLSDNPFQPDVFHLRDPIKSNLYKFKAGGREEAHNWLTALQETLGLSTERNPANLITFE